MAHRDRSSVAALSRVLLLSLILVPAVMLLAAPNASARPTPTTLSGVRGDALAGTGSDGPNAPMVELTAPPDGTVYAAPATISAEAVASDANGIAQVAFLLNGQLYNYDSTAPYTLTMVNILAGSYTLTAYATNSNGASAWDSVTLTVTAPDPQITGLVETTLPRNGLVRIEGTNFGGYKGVRPDGKVLIGGIEAPVTRWTDTLVKAYVPASLSAGETTVQVVAGAQSSNVASLTVTEPPPQDGHIRWRFTMSSDYTTQRAGLAPDGTVYVHDVWGYLYALSPDGDLKWVRQVGLLGDYGPVSVGPDGTVYVASLTFAPDGVVINSGTIHAINPDGTEKWSVAAGSTIMSGPNIGPDGKIYAVSDVPGLGLFALDPQDGEVVWNTGLFHEWGIHGAEIVFGPPDHLYISYDMRAIQLATLFAYNLDGELQWERLAAQSASQPQPAVGPNGDVYNLRTGYTLAAFDSEGDELWLFPDIHQDPHPDVGADGTIYIRRHLNKLLALTPDGDLKWTYETQGNLGQPIVRPQADQILMGSTLGFGESGVFIVVDSEGEEVWRQVIPDEPGFGTYGQVFPSSRPRFTSDGTTAYIAGDILGDNGSDNPLVRSFFYALEMDEPPPPASEHLFLPLVLR